MTIKDIAREAGYAVGTVSRVLNNQPGVSEKARREIMEVVEKYHFKLNNNAKLLKQQYNSGIAIIVKGTQNMLFASLVEMLQKLITENGYPCFMTYIDEAEQEVEHAIQICRERQPKGILFLGSTKENFQERFHQVNVPCVLVTNSADGLDFSNLSSICVDDVDAGKKATEHLIKLGHRKIGILGGEMGEMNASNPAKSRYQGCVEAFQENDVDFEPKNQFVSCCFSLNGGYHAMKKLLEYTPDLTAVFAMSDVTALGAIRAIKDSGLRVPEDVSVVGFDGIEMGQYIVPKLTTIQQPDIQLAERCVEILLQCIQEQGTTIREEIPFSLIVGESTRELQNE